MATDHLGPLSRALWPVVEEAVVTADRQVLTATLGTVNHLARSARSQGDVRSFAEVASLYPQAARRTLAVPGAEALGQGFGLADLAHHLLRLLPAAYWAGEAETDPDAFALVVVKESLEVARLLVDVGDGVGLGAWAREYRQAERSAVIRDEAIARKLSIMMQAGVMGLRGWILLSWKETWRDLQEEDATRLFRALDSLVEDEYVWSIAVEEEDEALGRSLGLAWWETGSRESGEAHVVQFGGYRDQALVIDLVARPPARREIPRRDLEHMTLTELKRHARAAQRLKRKLANIDEYSEVIGNAVQGRQAVEDALDRLIDALEDREATELAEKPIDETKIEVFARGVLASLNESDSFAASLPKCASGAAADEEVPELFGVFAYAPKDFFVDSEVHADPESLGTSTGTTVLRGEDRLILERLLEDCPRQTLGDRQISTVVKQELNRAKVRKGTRVVVFGMFDWWLDLRSALDQRDLGSGFLDPFEEAGVNYSYFPVQEANAVLVAHLPSLLCYRRVVASSDRHARGDIAELSVEPVTADEARESATSAAQVDGKLEARDEKVRRLLQNAKIRVLVRPKIQLRDPRAGVVITADGQVAAMPVGEGDDL